MRRDVRVLVGVLLVAALVARPVPARADAWFSPYLGTMFGGTASDLRDAVEAIDNLSDLTYGFSFGGMGGGIFGAEFDLGYTPKYFGGDSVVESSNLMTVQGSLLVGIPIGGQRGGGIRPYGVVGVGLIRRKVTVAQVLEDFSANDFGYNLGIGLMGFFNDTFGLRGEYRYFRNFQADDGFLTLSRGTFHVSRATVGIVLRF